jgi:iron complex transport system ATP-binding protein
LTEIEIDHLSVAFGNASVLEDVTLSVPGAAWVGVIGPNGAGKTTLLRTIAGFTVFAGDVVVGRRRVTNLSRRDLARLVAYVPQRPTIPVGLTVADYVVMGRTPYIAYFGVESRRDLEIVSDLLGRLGLGALAERELGSLSGGELQRVVLGRALAQQAPVLLLDEPTSALDIGHQQSVLELVDSLRGEQQLTVISAMHDLTLAGQFSDRLVLMGRGRIAAQGPPAEVLTEAAIATHYGARVRVERDGDAVLVTPRRGRDTAGIGST